MIRIESIRIENIGINPYTGLIGTQMLGCGSQNNTTHLHSAFCPVYFTDQKHLVKHYKIYLVTALCCNTYRNFWLQGVCRNSSWCLSDRRSSQWFCRSWLNIRVRYFPGRLNKPPHPARYYCVAPARSSRSGIPSSHAVHRVLIHVYV